MEGKQMEIIRDIKTSDLIQRYGSEKKNCETDVKAVMEIFRKWQKLVGVFTFALVATSMITVAISIIYLYGNRSDLMPLCYQLIFFLAMAFCIFEYIVSPCLIRRQSFVIDELCIRKYTESLKEKSFLYGQVLRYVEDDYLAYKTYFLSLLELEMLDFYGMMSQLDLDISEIAKKLDEANKAYAICLENMDGINNLVGRRKGYYKVYSMELEPIKSKVSKLKDKSKKQEIEIRKILRILKAKLFVLKDTKNSYFIGSDIADVLDWEEVLGKFIEKLNKASEKGIRPYEFDIKKLYSELKDLQKEVKRVQNDVFNRKNTGKLTMPLESYLKS
jgi:hypothetical protein